MCNAYQNFTLAEVVHRFCSYLEFNIFSLLHILTVFLSYFKLLRNTEDLASSERVREATTERQHQDGNGDELCDKDGNNLRKERKFSEGVEALLDDDGDLEVVRRPQSASDLEAEDLLRDRVHPVILMKGKEDAFEDEEQECSCRDVVKIGKYRLTLTEKWNKYVCVIQKKNRFSLEMEQQFK